MVTTTHNKDVYVPEEMLSLFPRLKKLLANPKMDEEFNHHEAVANRSKWLFNAVGLSSLVFIVVVLLITTWRFFLSKVGVHPPVYLLWGGAVLGCASFAMLLASHFIFRFQDKWLYSRFVVERLRQWRFQQLLDGDLIALSQSDPAAFERELTERWVKANFAIV